MTYFSFTMQIPYCPTNIKISPITKFTNFEINNVGFFSTCKLFTI